MTWAEAVKPLVVRFEIAAAFRQEAVWNARGSEAMAILLKEMAKRLDLAVEMGLAESPARRGSPEMADKPPHTHPDPEH